MTTNYASTLLPGVPGDKPYKITSYGSELRQHKKDLHGAFAVCKTPQPHQALFLAMAMIETNTMSIRDRDVIKDQTDNGSANMSIFNLNIDMLIRLGYAHPWKLNDPAHLSEAVCLLQKGIKKWGLIRTLNFVRGGYTAWQDGVSYDVWGYRRALATILKLMDAEPAILKDDRRVEIIVPYVGDGDRNLRS
jgi:hypothetical protein